MRSLIEISKFVENLIIVMDMFSTEIRIVFLTLHAVQYTWYMDGWMREFDFTLA